MSLMTDLNPDDDFLLDDGLPCLRKDGRLYYLGDVQPRVLDACRRFGLSFDQLADKLGIMRPALVLVLKGYDPVAPNLKSMLDRLVIQAAGMRDDDLAGESEAQTPVDVVAEPVVAAAPVQKATILSVPIPEAAPGPAPGPAPLAEPATEEVVIPDVVSLDRPATPHVVIPTPPAFEEGLPGVSAGLRRQPRRRGVKSSGGKPGQFLLT